MAVEAEQVRLIFKLFVEGHNGSGPMGIKAIATWLNERGYATRTGGRWGNGRVHALLSNPVYAGRQRFNFKDSRTFRLKSASEHVYCDTPAIIGHELFDRVQALLKSRNPRVNPPRVVTAKAHQWAGPASRPAACTSWRLSALVHCAGLEDDGMARRGGQSGGSVSEPSLFERGFQLLAR